MPVMDRVNKAQDQILESMEQLQTQLLEANRKIVKANKQLTDRVSDRLAGRVPTIPVPDAATERMSDAMPSANEAVDSYFTFVERATKANRSFASELVKVWTDDEVQEAAAPAAAPAKKPAAKKPAAKKSTAKKPTAKKSTTATDK